MFARLVGHSQNKLLAIQGFTILGIYPKDTKMLIRRDTCAPVFIAVLPTITRLWKGPKYPSTDKWIRKVWYVCVCIYIHIYVYIYIYIHNILCVYTHTHI